MTRRAAAATRPAPPTQLSTRATPVVCKVAAQHGVDLATVTGTGAGGRITAADVRRAAPRPTARVTAAAASRPRLLVEQRSYWTQANTMVEVDVYAANPLADDLRQNNPELYAAATARAGQPPTLFASGDLPLFTTSGIAPPMLMQLPWVLRHRAAAATAETANELFETYGRPTRETWDAALMLACLDPQVLQYEHRLKAWAGGLDV